jgi:hypothetical protein
MTIVYDGYAFNAVIQQSKERLIYRQDVIV